MTPSQESYSVRELVDLEGAGPGRVQVIGTRATDGNWLIQLTYGWADRVVAACPYKRDAIALGQALATVLGPDVHLDVIP